MLAGLREALSTSSRAQIETINQLDDVLDRLNTAIKAYLISIPPQTLKPSDAQRLAQILDALRGLKRVNSHLIEGAAYPVLSAKGALLPTRLRSAAQRS